MTVGLTLGYIFTEIIQLNPIVFWGVNALNPNLELTKEHFQNHLLNKAFSEQKLSYLRNEGVSKALLGFNAVDKGVDIFSLKFIASKPMIIFPKHTTSLMPLIQKGGDVLIIENNKVAIGEFKFRHVEFNELGPGPYLDEILSKYEQNFNRIPILLDCATESIYKEILNYTNQGPDPNSLIIFNKNELKLASVEELESYPKKAKFDHFLVDDKSSFYEPASKEQLDFKDFCANSLNEDFQKNYNGFKGVNIAKVQAGDFKYNTDSVALFKHTFYEK